MSSSNKIVEGKKVPISLTMECGETDKFPRAFIYDENNSSIATLDLGHIANGYYAPTPAYLMPSTEFIKVIYVVFDDAAHTQLSEAGQGEDTFVRETVHEITWDEPIADHLTPGSTGETLNLLTALDLDKLLSKLILSDVVARIKDDEPIAGVVSLEQETINLNVSEEITVFAFVGEADEIHSNVDGNGEIIGVTNEC